MMLSRRLSEAIGSTLDDAAGQLASARGQVNSAKAAIRSAEESAVRDAVTQALTTIQDSLKTAGQRDQPRTTSGSWRIFRPGEGPAGGGKRPVSGEDRGHPPEPLPDGGGKAGSHGRHRKRPLNTSASRRSWRRWTCAWRPWASWDEASRGQGVAEAAGGAGEKQLRGPGNRRGWPPAGGQGNSGGHHHGRRRPRCISANIQLDSALTAGAGSPDAE